MASNKLRLPSSGAGLTSFAAEYKSNLQLQPGHVVALVIAVIILEILLHALM